MNKCNNLSNKKIKQLQEQINSYSAYLFAPEDALSNLQQIISTLPLQQKKAKDYLLLLTKLEKRINSS